MIQRIQSIYLLLVVLAAGLLPIYLPLWEDLQGENHFASSQPIAFGIFGGAAILALIDIFLFKNRKTQIGLNRFNILSNFVLLGFFVYWTLMIPGAMEIAEKGIGMLIPIISVVFLALANKAIKKDEALVKSVDRLR